MTSPAAARDRPRVVARRSRRASRPSQLDADVKPKLRGWLHAGMTPSPSSRASSWSSSPAPRTGKVAAAVFGGTAVLLFGTSAVYHRGTWSPRVGGFLRRFDHSNIFLIIAGTYTPFAAAPAAGPGPPDAPHRVERRHHRRALPRLLDRRPPLALRPRLRRCSAGSRSSTSARSSSTPAAAVMTWIIVGGALYSLGAIVYGTKRPDLAAVVRLPRGLPRADDPRLHGALRRAHPSP